MRVSICLLGRVGVFVASCAALPSSTWAQAPLPTPTAAPAVAPNAPPTPAATADVAPAPAPKPAPQAASPVAPAPLPLPAPEAASTSTIKAPIAPLSPAAPEADVARLEVVLQKLADHSAISAGDIVYGFLFSGVNLFAGIYVAIDGAEMGIGEGRAAVSGVLIGLGAMQLANTLHAIGRETTDQPRLQRFRAARAAGTIDRTALARFEGELQAEVDIARYQRVVTGVQFIGLAAGGAGVIAIAAGVDRLSDDGRLVAGVLGGTYVVLGTWQAIAMLTGESFYERIQREYQQTSTAASPTTISIAPSVGPSAFGLSLSATF